MAVIVRIDQNTAKQNRQTSKAASSLLTEYLESIYVYVPIPIVFYVLFYSTVLTMPIFLPCTFIPQQFTSYFIWQLFE